MNLDAVDFLECSFRIGEGYSTSDVYDFIENIRNRKRGDGEEFFYKAQMEVLTIVGERVCIELVESAQQQDLSRFLL